MAQAFNQHPIRLGSANLNNGNVIDSFNNSLVYSDPENDQILRWLSPLEPDTRHRETHTTRFEGVGDQLQETSEFREWRGGVGGADKAVLFCSGNPGAGKTYLSSFVIDSLCDLAKEGDIAVAWLYCDHTAQQEQTVTNIMGAILKRLIGEGIPRDIREAFQQEKRGFGGRGLRLTDLVRMVKNAIASLPQTFICIDAIDECLPKDLPLLLESLRDIVREFPRTKIFLTGRLHVSEVIQKYFVGALSIPICPNPNDIRNYLVMRLDRDDDPDAMDNDLREDIVKVIVDKMSDSFLLVSLSVDAILEQATIRRRRIKLEELAGGNGLRDAYTVTLTRVKAQKGDKSVLGLKALMWALYSERPLRSQELCYALAVETGFTNLDPENVPTIRTLLSSCLGLLTIETSSSTVRLVHFTLKESLSSDPTLFHSPHTTIAEVCLTYLNFRSVRALSPALESGPSTIPLLEYASCYWGEHAKRGMTGNVKILALRLLDRFDEHISAQILLLRNCQYTGWTSLLSQVAGGPKRFTGLHVLAFLGIAEILPAALDMKKWNVNERDCTGNSAIMWAVRRGHEEVVKVLLKQKGIYLNLGDSGYGRTLLIWAIIGGRQKVVKILLEQGDVDPNRADTEYGRTPLSWAAESGHKEIVLVLLEREDIKPDQADAEYGRTPLMWAIIAEREGVVKILLDREDINPNYAHPECGVTPLLLAAVSGHVGIVKSLVGREDVDPNLADTKYGQTPLSRAAAWGHGGVVRMLLELENIRPNIVDMKYERSPLEWAARNGHEGIVKLLLERQDMS